MKKVQILKKLSVTFYFIFFFLCFCHMNSAKASNRQPFQTFKEGQVLSGYSSYYGPKFNGRKTANGEVFDMYQMTAAHRALPFNTILEVENLNNHKKVRVRINDRGPFKKGRILDLSYGAAKKIGLIATGVAKIKAKIIQLGH